MNIFPEELYDELEREITPPLLEGRHQDSVRIIGEWILKFHAAIPEKKRISTGIHTVLKCLGDCVYTIAEEIDGSPEVLFIRLSGVFGYLDTVIENGGAKKGGIIPLNEFSPIRVQAVVLRSLCVWGAGNENQAEKVFPFVEKGAGSENWEYREHTSGFFRLMMKAKKHEIRNYLDELSRNEDPNLRRFVSETLRPVTACAWIQKDPEYSLSVLRRMFTEHNSYPRTSVGNNLSDLARKNPELIYEIVEQLVASGNPDSFWIARRACRNLVKKEPRRVLDLLKVDEYKYKDRYFHR